jgi:hypothetical protein
VLASKSVIYDYGTLQAKGGDGVDGDANVPSGAGASGGIVHLIAPTISVPGTIDVRAGTGGAAGGPGTITAAHRIGGCSGGALGGNGGYGASVATDGSYSAPGDGTSIGALYSFVDPTTLF